MKISRAIFKLSAVLGAVLLLAFGKAAPATSATESTADFNVTTVYLVRHAEKAATPPADPPLTEAGQARAKSLLRILGKAGIKTIYTSQYARTKQTAEPLAQALGIAATVVPVSMDTMNAKEIAPQYLKDMVERIYAQAGQSVLIVGHSNTVPALIKALGGDIVPTIEDSDYDNLYVVTVVAKGRAKVANLRQ
ncbi:MAG: histidine phosphatase family protein [Acidobacteria bacterium]|nr:histidine phosphatase family protein [Acidobacteriota bacterium]MBI3427446.1 histidine phosphatase family protein [Acidobacteriota bacterium]